jgi:ankyrin repeat protein
MLLVSRDADIHQTTIDGYTVLMYAIINNNNSLAMTFIDWGVAINAHTSVSVYLILIASTGYV